MTDEQLMGLFQSTGGAQAFAELYRRHHKYVRNFLKRFRVPAEDASQETWMRVLKCKLPVRRSFRGLLISMAEQVACDHLRKVKSDELRITVIKERLSSEATESFDLESLPTNDQRLIERLKLKSMKAVALENGVPRWKLYARIKRMRIAIDRH